MTNVVEAFAWTERDAYKNSEDIFHVAREAVETSLEGDVVALNSDPHNLAAYVRSEGYEIDHLETLAVQEAVLAEVQREHNMTIEDSNRRVTDTVRSSIQQRVPNWQEINLASVDDVLTGEVVYEIDADIDLERRVADEMDLRGYEGINQSRIADEILEMQLEIKRSQQGPPDKPPLQGVVKIAGIQEVDKG